MQYKIPVQIENEDPIVLGLSLKQLAIIMVGGGFAYSIFNNLQKSVGPEIAAFPAGIVLVLTLLIALFKQHEMTFVPYILAFLRFNINFKERSWKNGVDSFSAIDIGIISITEVKTDGNISVESKNEKIKELQEKINKI